MSKEPQRHRGAEFLFKKLSVSLCLCGLLLGCAGDPDLQRDFDNQMISGEVHFGGGRFDNAVRAYARATELKPNHYQAFIGLGSSASEHSMALYGEADRLQAVGKVAPTEDALRRADEMTDIAQRSFTKALQLRPNDPVANYLLGVMFFKRATSPYAFPYPSNNEKAALQRQKERDEAIRQFEIVLAREKVALDHPEHMGKCVSPQMHRYLAIAHLTRGDWERRDVERMREHLAFYLLWLQRNREEIVKRSGGRSDEEKARRERDLQTIDRELLDVKELLRGWLENLRVYESEVRQGKEHPPIPADRRDARLESLSRELLIVEAMVREFDQASGGDGKKP